MTAFYYFCGHEQWQPEQLVRHAVLAEEAGFDGVVVSEHFHPWVDDESASGFAFSTLGAMAQATERVRLVTGVTTPLFRYHPGVVAQAAATIDRLSNGRFDLGVGTGENINEGPLGYSFPAYKERAGRMREALQIMRRLLDHANHRVLLHIRRCDILPALPTIIGLVNKLTAHINPVFDMRRKTQWKIPVPAIFQIGRCPAVARLGPSMDRHMRLSNHHNTAHAVRVKVMELRTNDSCIAYLSTLEEILFDFVTAGRICL